MPSPFSPENKTHFWIRANVTTDRDSVPGDLEFFAILDTGASNVVIPTTIATTCLNLDITMDELTTWGDLAGSSEEAARKELRSLLGLIAARNGEGVNVKSSTLASGSSIPALEQNGRVICGPTRSDVIADVDNIPVRVVYMKHSHQHVIIGMSLIRRFLFAALPTPDAKIGIQPPQGVLLKCGARCWFATKALTCLSRCYSVGEPDYELSLSSPHGAFF